MDPFGNELLLFVCGFSQDLLFLFVFFLFVSCLFYVVFTGCSVVLAGFRMVFLGLFAATSSQKQRKKAKASCFTLSSRISFRSLGTKSKPKITNHNKTKLSLRFLKLIYQSIFILGHPIRAKPTCANST